MKRSINGVDLYDNEIFVDRYQMNLARTMSDSDIWIGACRNQITRHIFANGIDFVRNNTPQKLTEEFEHVVRKHWIPFGVNVIIDKQDFGFVPVGIARNKLGNYSYPYVPEYGSYEVSCYSVHGEKHYRFWWKSGYGSNNVNKSTALMHDPKIVIFATNGHEPTISGKIRSDIFRLLSQSNFIQTLEECAKVGEVMRAHPVVFTKAVDSRQGNIEGIHYDFYAEGDAHEMREEDKYYRDNEAIEQAVRMQVEYHNQLLDPDDGPQKKTKISTEDVEKVPKQVPLPYGRDISSYTLPSMRNDLVNIKKLNQDDVCAILGVPKSMVVNDQSNRGNVAGMNETFKTTINDWKASLVEIYDYIYMLLYGDDEIARFMNNASSKKDAYVLEDESQLFTKFNKERITIRFSDSPYASTDQLNFMKARGLIGWKDYAKYYLLANNMKFESLDKEKDPWSDEKQMALVMKGGYQRASAPEIDSKTKRSMLESSDKQQSKRQKSDIEEKTDKDRTRSEAVDVN